MPQSKNKYEDRLLRVLTYIHDHTGDELNLDKIAEVACMSRFHWHRIFRAITGETIADAVRRIRLHRASIDIVTSEDSLASIAKRHGYPNVASFTRAFSLAYEMPPATLRKLGKVQVPDVVRPKRNSSMYPVKIQTYDEIKVATILHTGPYDQVSSAFDQLMGIFMSHNLLEHFQGMVGIYHDDPDVVPAKDLRFHAGIIVKDPDALPDSIKGLELITVEEGKYAVMEHKGPYATLADAYQWLFGSWLPQSNEEPCDAPLIEFYVNNPREVPAKDIRTDVRLKVA